MPIREIKRHVRALACHRPEGWKTQGHVSPTRTSYLTYRIGLFRVSGSGSRGLRVEGVKCGVQG